MLLYTSKHILSYKKSLLSNEEMFRCVFIFGQVLRSNIIIYLLWRKWLLLFLVMDQRTLGSIERLFFTLKKVACIVSVIFIPPIFVCIMYYCFCEEKKVGILIFYYKMKMVILSIPKRLLNSFELYIDFTFVLLKLSHQIFSWVEGCFNNGSVISGLPLTSPNLLGLPIIKRN